MATIVYDRKIMKNGDGPATLPPSPAHDTGDWIATDIYENELYMDNLTRNVYTRFGNTIVLLTRATAASGTTIEVSTDKPIPDPPTNNNWTNLGDPYIGSWNVGLTPNFGEYVTEGADIYQNISGANSAVLPSLDGGANWNYFDTGYIGTWSSGNTYAQGVYTDHSGFLYFHITALQEEYHRIYFDGTSFFFQSNLATWMRLDVTKLTINRIESALGMALVLASQTINLQSTGSVNVTSATSTNINSDVAAILGVDNNDEVRVHDNNAADVSASTTDKKAVIIASYGSTVRQLVKNALVECGTLGIAEHRGELVHGNFANAQSGKVALFADTNDATLTEITLNGTGSDYFTIPINCTYHITMRAICTNRVTGDSATYIGDGVISNVAGTTSTGGLAFNVTQTHAQGGMGATALALSADNANDRLAVKVTGLGGTDIRWNVVVEYVKIKFT